MIKLLLEHGADKNLTIEDYRPVDLIKPDRAQALQQFRLNSFGGKKQENRLVRINELILASVCSNKFFSWVESFTPGCEDTYPGVDVMITIFGDFCQFLVLKIGVFLKNQCIDHRLKKKTSSENILKITTSVPVQKVFKTCLITG
jgi:hypothetical protein